MNVEVAVFVRFFSLTLPFFTALTSVVIVSSSCDKSAEGILNRRLLILLLALMGTWVGFFLYFYAPEAARLFLPVYALSVLCVPASLYVYLYTLVRGVRIGRKSRAKHYLAPAVIAVTTAIFMGLSDESFQDVIRNGLSMLRPTFSVAYTAMILYLLWQEYHRKRLLGRTTLIPTGRLLVLILLPLIQLVNSVVLIFATKELHPLAIAATALLISILITVLLYNTICRNLELFRAKKISKKSYIPKRKKALKPPAVYTPARTRLPFSRQHLEEVFLKEKLYLDPKLSLAALCKRFDTNRTYISNFTNRTYGLNFSQYVNYYRLKELEWLQSLPENNNESLNKLSVQAGFKDYYHYRRAMRTKYNIISQKETNGDS